MSKCLLVGLAIFGLAGADWPQWQGPDRTNISAEKGLLQSWPKPGPALLWTYSEAGLGYSGPAIVGGRLYMMGTRDKNEVVLALDAKTGKEFWATPVGEIFTFKGNSWGDGPRGTPTVDGDVLYTLGGQGILVCLETGSGKERWRVDMYKDLAGVMSQAGGSNWGYSWSPLVDGDKLICVPGGPQGTLAALDKKTGKEVWRSKDLTAPSTYSSPIVAKIDGVRQYIQMTDFGLAGVAAQDGRLLWTYDRNPPYNDVIITTPVYHDHLVYATAGFGIGCDLVKLTKSGDSFKAAKVYANKIMKNRLGGVVLIDGYLYGSSEGRGWICQDFKTGKEVWGKKSLGIGSLTSADGNLYCYSEQDGIAALIEASPRGWKEKGRFEIPKKTSDRAPEGKIWTHPVVADGCLFLRDQELIFCYDVKGQAGARR